MAFILINGHFEGATPDGFGQGDTLLSRSGNMGFLLAVSTPPSELETRHSEATPRPLFALFP